MRKSTIFSAKSIGASIAMASLLAVPATMAITGVAGAQPTGGDLPAAGYLPSANLTSNLTIHKLAGAESGTQDLGTANQDIPAGATPLEGVTFKVERVNVDLTQREGWDAARGMTPETAATELDAGFTALEGVTNDQGLLQFENLPLGMYLVTETNAPQGVITGQPFLVYLPMTVDSDGDGALDDWNQDVHVYPKNSVLTLDKEVTDEGMQAGDTINYTITGTVPTSLTENSVIANAKFEFHDFLDAENAYVGEDQAIVLTVSGGDQDGTTLDANTHYVVEGNNAGPDTAGSLEGPRGTQHIKVTLTEAGLQAIIGADTVQMTMEAVVKPVADTDGITFNFVRQLTNDGRGGGSITTSNIPGDEPENPTDNPDPNNPTPGVETYHGQAIINKVDPDNNKAPLEGAEFALYASTFPDLATVADVIDKGSVVTVSDQDSWTTDADGTVTIDGIHASDFADNGINSDKVYYYLVETEAPDGYVLLDVVVPFELSVEDATAGGDPMQFTAEVENVTDDNFLPMTGGAGIVGLLAAGGLLVGGGVAANRMLNRDKGEDAEADVKA